MVRNFFYTWFKLLTTPQTYWQVASWPARDITIFFIFSSLCLGIVMASDFVFRKIPSYVNYFQAAINDVPQHYPNDLKISWDQNQLTLAPPLPVEVRYPTTVDPVAWGLPPVLAYLVPSEQPINTWVDQLPHSSWAIITPQHLYISNLAGDWTAWPLIELAADVPKYSLTTNTLPELVTFTQDLARGFFRLLQLGAWIFFPLYILVVRSWISLLDGLFIYLFFRFMVVRIPFKVVWSLTAVIALVAQFIELIANLLYASLNLPLFTLAFWSILALVLFTERQKFTN